jgi:TonB family protein
LEFQKKTLFRCGALLCLVLVAGTAWGKPAKDKQPKALSDWNTRLQTLQTHLIAGEHRQALDLALPLQREMMDQIQSGPGAASALAVTALSRALAEAGLGDMEAAAWDWYTALTLDPTIIEVDLTPFGAAGAALKAFGPPPVEEADKRDRIPKDGKPCDPKNEECVNRPELVKQQAPGYPGALRAACLEGTVVVSSIIDTEGKIRTPWLKKPPDSPVMALAAMESLRTWRFKPATFKGEPVKVYYELNVNFKVQRPCIKRS